MNREIESASRLHNLTVLLPTLGIDGAWLAGRIESWLAGADETLDSVLGLTGRARQTYRIYRRDLLLRELRRRFYGDLSVNAAASAIVDDLRRYEASAWRLDFRREEMPEGYVETPKEIMFRLLKIGCHMPSSSSQIRGILSGDKKSDIADEMAS